nr:hypothetical protein [Tanacetum cinerariifolium]
MMEEEVDKVKQDVMQKVDDIEEGKYVLTKNGMYNIKGVRNNKKEARSTQRNAKQLLVQKEFIEAIKTNANNYANFYDYNENELSDGEGNNGIRIMDKFLKCIKKPSAEEGKSWNQKMIRPFKDNYKVRDDLNMNANEEIMDDTTVMAMFMTYNEVFAKRGCVLNEKEEWWIYK